MAEPEEASQRRLAEARAGSAQALGEALEACRGYLLLVAERELGADLRAKGGASDLVQETFLEAQRDFARFQGASEDDLRAWLRRLLLNNLSNFARHYRGTARRQLGRERALADSQLERGGGLAAGGPSPSGQAMAHEQAQALQEALQRLPDEYRQALALRHQEHLSFEEIGARLGRTANAARLLWLRAVERLQRELGEAP